MKPLPLRFFLSAAASNSPKQSGFTLIELMITVAVVAILAVIAMPAYTDYVQKSRRADGRAALIAVAIAQEQFRAKCPSYAANFSANCSIDLNGDGDTSDVGETIAFTGVAGSPDGYYTVTISAASATAFAANASPQGVQANDTACDVAAEFSVNQNGPVETNAAQRLCWGK